MQATGLPGHSRVCRLLKEYNSAVVLLFYAA